MNSYTPKYFKIEELVDPETFKLKGEKSLALLDSRILYSIDCIRKFLNKSITINNWATGGNRNWSGLRTDKAAAIVDQALILSGQSLLASSEARVNVEQSIKAASLVAWSVFLAAALSLIASIFGGLFGATTATRVTWEDNSAIVKPAF